MCYILYLRIYYINIFHTMILGFGDPSKFKLNRFICSGNRGGSSEENGWSCNEWSSWGIIIGKTLFGFIAFEYSVKSGIMWYNLPYLVERCSCLEMKCNVMLMWSFSIDNKQQQFVNLCNPLSELLCLNA